MDEENRKKRRNKDGQPSATRKGVMREISDFVKSLDQNIDPTEIGQADINYLIFKCSQRPGNWRDNLISMAGFCLAASDYFDQGHLQYEGHIAIDPIMDQLRSRYPAASREELMAMRSEIDKRSHQEPDTIPFPLDRVNPDPEPEPDQPKTRSPWVSTINIGV